MFSNFAKQFFIGSSLTYVLEKLFNATFGIDMYKEEAEEKLIGLISLLNDINVITNYELLLNSKFDSRKFEIAIDDNNKKVLVENKYIMVPTHNPMFNNEGETQLTSLHQQHIIGTDEYSLSLGFNQKNKQKVLGLALSTIRRN